ncbi:NUDIX hydrolase [Cellulophaga tyrosinoxydans]|uniref:ADP-ribose pyrophosphatase YjhB, NUDIX family n=1 Tax=Cellulophaga tyrosinoxydans TaxID=504486 RepID=A0A1W1Y6M7_9FLAO|nr:NUDIX hydrolase [Cellulophaga tyrosinoxydans]SMC31789.1 ADP-ribose pyrophosphatase YjhB, NUDIX family [Cellulophaga tyrosinoxydans]|tara:strand:- start:131 stop:718 length:588 start_codon:yes stop_codon:yes gene_type:complete
MYKVFVNESQLILTNKLSDIASNKYFLLNQKSIRAAIDLLAKNKVSIAYIYHPNNEEILNKFTKKIPLVVAAGGVVTNREGKVLFIYRNNKWDLPKGKIDKGETLEECALREVAEETGVQGLKIENILKTTYHVFKRNGTYKLKEVHWFAMKTSYKGELVGQLDEGIEKVRWKGPVKIAKALENSYANIKILFED